MNLDYVLEQIRKRGTLRTPGLALVAHMGEEQLDAQLAPLCAPGGPLVSCDVEVAGKRVKEYRISTIGGGKLNDVWAATPGRPRTKTEAKPDPAFGDPKAVGRALAARFCSPLSKRTAVSESTAQEKPTMKKTAIDKLSDAFKTHGPMLLAEIRARVKGIDHTATVSAGHKRGIFAKLGGESKRKTLWGLPGQKIKTGLAAAVPPPVSKLQPHGAPYYGEIQDGVPLPEKKSYGELRQALEALAPGQSRVVEGIPSVKIYKTAARLGISISARAEGEGIRVWRRK